MLGFEPVVVGMLRKSKGEKAHLDITMRDLENFENTLQHATVVGVLEQHDSGSLNALKRATAYISIDSPSIYSALDLSRSPWIQVQYGASDLLFSVARAQAKSDVFGIWGKKWIGPDLMKHPRITSELRGAMGYIASRPNAVLGNVTLPPQESVASSPENVQSRVTYFEPHVLSRSGNYIQDRIAKARFSSKFSAQRQNIGAQLHHVADAINRLSYDVIYRKREKTLAAPLGQEYFVRAASTRDQLVDILHSNLIVSFSPSVSALEALWFGKKVVQFDSRDLIDPRHDNYLTPNHLMYEQLRLENAEFFRTPDHEGNPREFSTWMSNYHPGKEPILEGWCDRDVNLPEALDSLIWKSKRS